MYGIDRKRYFWVTVSALAQGLLLGAYAAAQGGPLFSMPLSLVVIPPVVLWLAQEHWGRRLRRFLLGLTLVLAVLYAYRLWSIYPQGGFYVVPSQRLELLRTCAAVFLLIPFFQCRIATWSWKMPYSDLFFQLCRNIFLLFQAAIVTSVFWGLLLTAGLLFDIVGLEAVPRLLRNPLVAVPLTSLTVAISISVALKHPGIDSLGRWILSALAWLLPPFSFLSLVFIACLPFSGLQPLWATGQASSWMLLLQLGTLLLANAAWLDGTRNPFPNRWVNLLAQASLLCLPIYTALCAYSVGLRVQQYGLSIDRIQAVFMMAVLGVWGLGYAGAVLLRRWPSAIGQVNIACVLFMALVVAAMNSPILDPYRLAANNQADRLLRGQIPPEDFDYLYMRFSLGRYGNYALARIGESGHPREAAIQRRVSAALAVDPQEYLKNLQNDVPPASLRLEILNNAAVYPTGRHLSDSLVNYLVQYWEAEGSLLRGVRRSKEAAFIFGKAIPGAEEEDVLMILEGRGLLLRPASGNEPPRALGTVQGEALSPSLTPSDLTTVEPQFMDLDVKGKRLQIRALP